MSTISRTGGRLTLLLLVAVACAPVFADQRSAPLEHRNTSRGLGLDLIPSQDGSPVTLLSARSTATDGPYQAVRWTNVSSKRISSITLGLFLDADRDGGDGIFRTKSFLVSAAAGQTSELLPAFATREEYERLAASRNASSLQLGVVAVTFADSSRWTFDIHSERGFGSPKGPSEAVSCEGSIDSPLDAVRWVLAKLDAGPFECKPTQNPTACANADTSCTTSLCVGGGECEHTKCEYIIPPTAFVSATHTLK